MFYSALIACSLALASLLFVSCNEEGTSVFIPGDGSGKRRTNAPCAVNFGVTINTGGNPGVSTFTNANTFIAVDHTTYAVYVTASEMGSPAVIWSLAKIGSNYQETVHSITSTPPYQITGFLVDNNELYISSSTSGAPYALSSSYHSVAMSITQGTMTAPGLLFNSHLSQNSGNLYTYDGTNEISASTLSNPSTIASITNLILDTPLYGGAVNSSGNIFYATSTNLTDHKSGGANRYHARAGTDVPNKMAFDASDNLYFIDNNQLYVLKNNALSATLFAPTNSFTFSGIFSLDIGGGPFGDENTLFVLDNNAGAIDVYYIPLDNC